MSLTRSSKFSASKLAYIGRGLGCSEVINLTQSLLKLYLTSTYQSKV